MMYPQCIASLLKSPCQVNSFYLVQNIILYSLIELICFINVWETVALVCTLSGVDRENQASRYVARSASFRSPCAPCSQHPIRVCIEDTIAIILLS
jgi:hypothetical protein